MIKRFRMGRKHVANYIFLQYEYSNMKNKKNKKISTFFAVCHKYQENDQKNGLFFGKKNDENSKCADFSKNYFLTKPSKLRTPFLMFWTYFEPFVHISPRCEIIDMVMPPTLETSILTKPRNL